MLRGLDKFEGRSSLRTWIFRILVNRARTRAVREARSVPFASLEEDDRPAVDPAAFDSDGGWTSAPPRLETDPEGSLLSAELREPCSRRSRAWSPAQRAVITLRDLLAYPRMRCPSCSTSPTSTSGCCCTAHARACARPWRRSWR